MNRAMVAGKRGVRWVMPESFYGAYRRFRVRRMIAAFEPRVVEHRFGARRRRVRLEDELARGWYDRDWDEPVEVRGIVEAGLGPGHTVFDVGAHQCVVAMMLADHVVPGGRVVAVEAEPHNARVGARNVALNDDVPVELVHAAVTERSGTVRFAESLNGRVATAGSAGTVDVPAVTLDDLSDVHGPPDFVMVDVEGFELAALHGGRKMLTRDRPVLAIELHVGCGLEDAGGTSGQVLELLRSYGYDIAVADEDEQDSRFRPLADVPLPLVARCFLLAVPADAR